jgi:perosamine synthetase
LESKLAGRGRIPIAGPSITKKEIEYVADAVSRCWYQDANLYHEKFQRAFAAYLGVKHATPLPSCTAAIHLALAGLGIGPSDEVIVPESTWIASAAPINYLGATPVFADVDEETWCLSAQSLAQHLTPRTKAVIAVDLYGGVPDYDALRAVCGPRGIPIVEDAAEAIGAEFGGKRAGSLGDLGVFSFHGSKTLTTGEGGMLVTDRDDISRRVTVLQDHGQDPTDRLYFNREIAFKYRMSSMQAALGLAQLERIDELVARKREIFSWYWQELGEVDGLKLNREPPGTKNGYWMVTVVIDDSFALPKVALMEALAAEGIDTRPFFYPLSSLPAYGFLGGEAKWLPENPIAYRLSRQAINLPSALNLGRDDVLRVCSSLKAQLVRSKKPMGRVAASHR